MVAPTLALGRHVAPRAPGRIGPNAILQLIPVLERVGGRDLRDRLFAEAGVFHLPEGGAGLIDEGPVARVQQEMRRQMPALAPALAWEAGTRTADYILAHRIPKPAQRVLKALPVPLSAPLLSKAIARNAWTFAGSGRFRLAAARPPVFEIADNPVVRGETAPGPICHWHAAVFERLFRTLVHPGAQVSESACCATGACACRFEVAVQGR